MTLGRKPENKWSLGYRGKTITVVSQPVTDESLKLRNTIRIPARSFIMAPTYCEQMFSGRTTSVSSDELKQSFPNIYMESMQFNNSEGKSCDTIPYVSINLDYEDPVYIGKKKLPKHISKMGTSHVNI